MNTPRMPNVGQVSPMMHRKGQAPPQVDHQAAAQAAIMQAVQQLGMSAYLRLAGDYLARREGQPAEPERLRELAKQAQTAARAYFEGVGMLEVDTSAGDGQ